LLLGGFQSALCFGKGTGKEACISRDAFEQFLNRRSFWKSGGQEVKGEGEGGGQEVCLEEVGSMSWGEFKPRLADAVVAHLEPLQAAYREVIADPTYLDEVRAPSFPSTAPL
jgi:hypothetical protein